MKKTLAACLLVLVVLAGCAKQGIETIGGIDEIRKGRPWIPATTKLVESQGQHALSDFVDYPFENDPSVIGTWQFVDFVRKKSDFRPGKSSWPETPFLKSLAFQPGGQVQLTFSNGSTAQRWTKGHVLSEAGGGSDETYEVLSLAGKEYLFFQWKSGDYHLRYDEPQYYVLVKGTAETSTENQSAPPPVQEQKVAYSTLLSQGAGLQVVRRPPPLAFGRGALASLPKYDPASSAGWQVDVRGSDLSRLDLSGRLSDLLHADFDSVTTWPSRLPRGFDPARIMDLGKNPGLGLRGLHAAGHTGKGIGIAIIDQALLVDHVEYKDQLRMYEEIHWPEGTPAQMHAPAVASLAVGKTVGVAPEADLYFIANWMGITLANGEFEYELSSMAAAIDRVISINRTLAPGSRIRVISISLGVNPAMKGYALVKDAVARALEEEIYVAYVGSNPFMGMGRDAGKDPDDFRSYGPGEFWSSNPGAGAGALMIPMDARCTASPTGASDYVFYSEGGMSWTVPYVAGLYALACQQDPRTTPAAFWAAATETARTASFGKIVDPARLLEALGR